MTKDEIKKALECCSNPSINFCKDCPYNNNGEFSCCDGEMCKDALNLITEQEKEIEKLKAENIRLTTKLGQVLLSIDTVKEMNTMCSIDEQRKQAKIDLLNQLKAKSYVNDYCREVVELEKIDELIKEAQND